MADQIPEFTDANFDNHLETVASRFRIFVGLEIILFAVSLFLLTSSGVAVWFHLPLAITLLVGSIFFTVLFLFFITHRIVTYINGVKLVFSLLAAQNKIIVSMFRAAESPQTGRARGL